MKEMKSSVFIQLILAVGLVISDDDEDWNQFKQRHKKQYIPGEDASRKGNFRLAKTGITQVNAKNLTWRAGHNEFSDWSNSEKQALRGLKITTVTPNKTLDIFPDTRQLPPPPSSMDLRSHRCMRPVLNQGQCGSCWAFAALNSLEFSRCLKTNVAVSLSVQQLTSCDRGYGNFGCYGGFYTNAWNYLQISSSGSIFSYAYPYTSGFNGVSGSCIYVNSAYVGATVRQFGMIRNDVVTIQLALMYYGPVAVGINATPNLSFYQNGVFSDPTCNTGGPNHAVNIVGYGTTGDGTNYWIVRNSWGSTWGLNGYFLIRRGVNMCFIEQFPAAVISG